MLCHSVHEFVRRLNRGSAALLWLLLVPVSLWGCRVGAGAGDTKFSSPSTCVAEAKRLGVLKGRGTGAKWTGTSDATGFKVDEVWLEEIVERDESTLVRKRAAGERLCVRMRITSLDEVKFFANNVVVLTGDSAKQIDLGPQVLSRGDTVWSFGDSDGPPVPRSGRIAIRKKKGGAEIARLDYQVDSAP